MDAQVLAINPASAKSHQNYREKKRFKFPILSDPEATTIAAFNANKGDGKGVTRTVYALAPDNRVIFAERGMADLEKVMAAIRAHK